MALTEKTSGSQTTSGSTEHQLGADQTDAETYLLRIDTNGLAKTDIIRLRSYVRTLSTDSDEKLERETYYHGGLRVADLEYVSIPVVSPNLCNFTLTLMSGVSSSVTVPWSILGFGDTVAIVDEDTQSVGTIDNEYTLGSALSGDESYLLRVDATNLAAGEQLVLRAKTKTRSSDTTRQEQVGLWHGECLIEKSLASIVVPSVHEVVFTLTQTMGTGRSFPWSIVSL